MKRAVARADAADAETNMLEDALSLLRAGDSELRSRAADADAAQAELVELRASHKEVCGLPLFSPHALWMFTSTHSCGVNSFVISLNYEVKFILTVLRLSSSA